MQISQTGSMSLLNVANALTSQVRNLGVLSMATHRIPNSLDNEFRRRTNFVFSFLQLLEVAAELRCGPNEFAHCYTSSDEAKVVRLAGFTDGSDSIRPSSILRAMLGMWSYEEDCRLRGRPPIFATLKAALLITASDGLAEAVRFLLRLQREGWTTTFASAGEAMCILLDAAAKVDADTEICGMFFQDGVPDVGSPDWYRSPTKWDSETWGPRRRPLDDIYSYLLEVTADEVEKTRAAATYDDWLLRQGSLTVLLTQVLVVFKRNMTNRSVSLESMLSHFEEIAADAGAFTKMLRMADSNRLVAMFDPTRFLVRLFKEKFPNEWERRIKQDRAVIPTVIESAFLKDGQELPPMWRQVSPTLAPVITALRGEPSCQTVVGDTVEPPTFEAVVSDLRSAIAQGQEGNPRRRFELLERILQHYPWLSFAYHELAIAFDECGDHKRALPLLEAAICIEPLETGRWQSLATVLGHIGCHKEAAIARATAKMVENFDD